MDFTFSTLIPSLQLNNSTCPNYEALLSGGNQITVYFINSDSNKKVAFNLYDFGNYLWGGAMNILGFSSLEARLWAHWNERNLGGDAPGDQLAIQCGHENMD